MVVISTEVYEEIRQFCFQYTDLSIHCEQELRQKWLNIDPLVIRAIHSKEWQKHIKNHHHNILRAANSLLKEYRQRAQATKFVQKNAFILLEIAKRERYSPVSLCRILLNLEYSDRPKASINDMLKNPHTIPDRLLALNVIQCLYNDNSDGPITDIVRRSIGEDYETRLKQKASEAGLVFHDEVYLRRYGYDKTPDLKLAVPCMFRGRLIHWIESKGSFGDMESHQRYISEQLASYGNRFGGGIIIYWLGYLDKIATCPENGDFIIVTDDFPDKNELILLNLPFK